MSVSPVRTVPLSAGNRWQKLAGALMMQLNHAGVSLHEIEEALKTPSTVASMAAIAKDSTRFKKIAKLLGRGRPQLLRATCDHFATHTSPVISYLDHVEAFAFVKNEELTALCYRYVDNMPPHSITLTMRVHDMEGGEGLVVQGINNLRRGLCAIHANEIPVIMEGQRQRAEAAGHPETVADTLEDLLTMKHFDALIEYDIFYLHEIATNWTRATLGKIPWVGEGTLGIIARVLREHGLELKYK